MAKRGRTPKPTALKKLEGNPGKRPLNELEPMPRVSMLRCPNWLEPEAKKEWRRLAPVLIDAGTASAAELFAAVMRDEYGAVLIGTTTYGKAVMQNTYSLSDGSALTLSVGTIYTKSGT